VRLRLKERRKNGEPNLGEIVLLPLLVLVLLVFAYSHGKAPPTLSEASATCRYFESII